MEFLLQPINSRTLLEEVNDNNGAIEPVRFPVTAPAEIELPAPAASSAESDGQICRAGTVAADMAQSSEHSIEQLDPKTPGWTQRWKDRKKEWGERAAGIGSRSTDLRDGHSSGGERGTARVRPQNSELER